jgi:hypothetical protein
MKKLFTLTLLGLAGLALTAGQASAGWLFHCGCKCYVNLRCKQYNAFSPYCCEFVPACSSAPVYVPNPAWSGGCPGGACYAGGPSYPGAVAVAPSLPGSPTAAPAPTAPATNGYMAASQPMHTLPPQAWQNWNPNWMNPTSMPSNYPGYAPSMPINNMGR